MLELLLTWQTLIGAFVGAATPVAFWFFTKWAENKKKRKHELLFMQKEVVFAINNALETRQTLKSFIQINLAELKARILASTDEDAYCASTAYMPKFHIHEIDARVTEIHYISGYLENSIMRCRSLSRDFDAQIQDLRGQYETGFTDVKALAINKVNTKAQHNNAYHGNIQSFEAVLQNVVIDKNIETYLNLLFKTLATLKEIDRLGVWRWRLKFSPSLKFFWKYKDYTQYKKDTYQRIDQHILIIAKEEQSKAVQNFES